MFRFRFPASLVPGFRSPRLRGSSATLLAASFILAACGGGQPAAPQPASSSAAASSPSSPVAKTSAQSSSASSSATSGSSSASAQASTGKLTNINVAWVAVTSHTLPTWIAEAKGMFKAQGLNAKVTYIQGSTTAIPALASGELSILEATPAASVQAQLKGQDTVVLATHVPWADQRLVAAPSIKTFDDQRGKTIAVTKPGTVTDVVMRAILKQKGLTPGKDVKLTYLDTQPAQLAALQKGIIQAMFTDPPFYLTAEKAGAHEILDSLSLHYPYPEDGVIASRKFVREHPDVVEAYLKAFVQAIRFIRSNPVETKQILAAKTKESDPAILDESYRVLLGDLVDDPEPSLDGIKTVLPLFPGGAGKNAADFVDPQPLQKAMAALGK